MKLFFSAISNIRNVRNSYGISPKEALEVKIKSGEYAKFADHLVVIQKLANITSIEETTDKVENAESFMVQKDEFYVVLGDHAKADDNKEEIEAEIKRLEGFKTGIEKKLSNEKFVNNAPEKVVAMEKKKLDDALEKIEILKAKL